ncbi:hypothetical protein CWI38_0655p0010 [Hamiltosporidium tvaerminnensis]|uniref:Uncharacterized protein n=1 Tax=Hamiltosporidium tvaerminnensis TaxID=1176355 RepID=A0A4Q9LVJ3_9MICR|nr:hypothetical protein CWI38_0655p0010 [Hamiltosporidium tvaerminnensis]
MTFQRAKERNFDAKEKPSEGMCQFCNQFIKKSKRFNDEFQEILEMDIQRKNDTGMTSLKKFRTIDQMYLFYKEEIKYTLNEEK